MQKALKRKLLILLEKVKILAVELCKALYWPRIAQKPPI